MENIADYLFRRRSPAFSPDGFADLLGSIGWSMDDDGSEISAALCRWLESGSEDQVRVALAYTEGLFHSRGEAERLLASARARFPELKTRCDEVFRAHFRV